MGNYRRIKFDAKDLNEAMAKAEYLLENDGEIHPLTIQDSMPVIHIADALIYAAKNRIWTEKNRKRDQLNCKYFLKWIDEKKLKFWHELRYEHMLEYKKYLIEKGSAYDTVRLYFQPVRRTSAWMAANYPKHYVNICQSLKISQKEIKNRRYISDRNPYLTIHQVLDLLDWMVRNQKQPGLIVGVALQGLAGLQMLEAIRLSEDNFNPIDGTIVIEGVVKNHYRIRKLPLPNVVTYLIKRYGLITMYSDNDQYGKALSKVLRMWDANLKIKPKDFRNTIQTTAIDQGWESYFLDRYVGHAPNTVRRKHYFNDSEERMIPLLKENVVRHIENEISIWNAPIDTTILPGPRLVMNQ